MSYRLWIWFALGEPPDCGLKNASAEVARWPKAAGFYSPVKPARLTGSPRAGGAAAPHRMVCGMSRPVIGICAALERAQWSVWDEQAMLLPRSYVTAVQRAD